MSKNERLYVNTESLGFEKSFLIVNPQLNIALHREFLLSSVDKAVYDYIVMEYDDHKEPAPVYVSYSELSEILGNRKNTIQTTIKVLLEYEIINKVGKRSGRSKTGYIPNIKKLHDILIKYLEYDKKCRSVPLHDTL